MVQEEGGSSPCVRAVGTKAARICGGGNQAQRRGCPAGSLTPSLAQLPTQGKGRGPFKRVSQLQTLGVRTLLPKLKLPFTSCTSETTGIKFVLEHCPFQKDLPTDARRGSELAGVEVRKRDMEKVPSSQPLGSNPQGAPLCHPQGLPPALWVSTSRSGVPTLWGQLMRSPNSGTLWLKPGHSSSHLGFHTDTDSAGTHTPHALLLSLGTH